MKDEEKNSFNLMNLYQEQDKLVSAFKVDLDNEAASGRTLTEDEMYDYIVEWADGQYVYYWDQWSIATACRFSADGDFSQVFEIAKHLSDGDVDNLMAVCTTMFVEHCIREQFAGYEIVGDEEVA